MSALSDALNDANVEGWSAAEIARRSGDRIHRATAANMLRGKHAANPSDDVLEAFAEVLDIPLVKLRQLAGRPGGTAEPYVPPPEADLLDARQRRAVDEVIRSMVGAEAVLPGYLVEVFDSMTPAEVTQFLRDLSGNSRERLDVLWRQRRQWTERGGLPVWEADTPDVEEYWAAQEAFEEFVFSRAPDEAKGRPVAEWHHPTGVQPVLADVLAARQRHQDAESRPVLQEAARKGKASLSEQRRRQDEAGEAPDPEGSPHGA